MVKHTRIYGFLLVALMLMLGACGNQQANDGHYQNDEYLGLTNTNPNLLNGANWSYERDVKVMRQALADVEGVQDATIVVEGGTAFVRLEIPERFDRAQIETVEQNAYRVLRAQVPRMKFNVTSNRSDYYQ